MSESRITNYVRAASRGILWLQKGGGKGLISALTGQFDAVLGRAVDGVRESMLLECSDKALDYHAFNSGERRVSGETSPQLRNYLAHRWDRHKEDGTEDGLHFQLTRLGYPNHELWSYQRLKLAGVPAGTAFGGAANSGFWFVVIRRPHPFNDGPVWDGGGSWDDGAEWGGSYSGPAGSLSAALAELAFVLQRRRPSGKSPRFVVFDLDGSTQVLTVPPYDFAGNYLIFPLREKGELMKSPIVPYFNASFINP